MKRSSLLSSLSIWLPLALGAGLIGTPTRCEKGAPPPCDPVPQQTVGAETAAPVKLGSWQDFRSIWQQKFGPVSLGENLPGDIPLPGAGEDALKVLTKLADHLGWPLAAPMDGLKDRMVTLLPGAVIAGAHSPEFREALARTRSADAEIRQEALRDLNLMADPRTESVMLHFLRGDTSPTVRAEAAASLRDSASTESLDALLSALADAEPWVSEHARYSLQELGAERAEPYLRTGMKSEDPRIAYESADILERAFGLAVPADFWADYARLHPAE